MQEVNTRGQQSHLTVFLLVTQLGFEALFQSQPSYSAVLSHCCPPALPMLSSAWVGGSCQLGPCRSCGSSTQHPGVNEVRRWLSMSWVTGVLCICDTVQPPSPLSACFHRFSQGTAHGAVSQVSASMISQAPGSQDTHIAVGSSLLCRDCGQRWVRRQHAPCEKETEG